MPAYKLILPVISFPSAKPLPPLKAPAEKKASALVPDDTFGLPGNRVPPLDDPFAC
ncbi:hypothetical protein SAMN05421771_1008 [Granulicella pectinivorans]|uniref:Uncharacterized protein n=1 Tax=Granulicella pectinivorans TaxID=474950 RepID=A0A1I6LNE5_9BACT|nr:hypothetical protein SAMN05421771_1008 [Granulicella pectinivorans]